MTREQIFKLRKDFDRYVDGFAVAGDGIHPLLQLKAKHSRRVADEARMLSADLGWSASERNVAEALGLLHDIGRFSQFLEYRTFSDSASVMGLQPELHTNVSARFRSRYYFTHYAAL